MSDSVPSKPRETPAERSARLSAAAKAPRRNRAADLPDSVADDAEAQGRLFNILDTARLLNRNRKTIMDWLDDDAPIHSRKGGQVMLDLAALTDWRENKARRKAERRTGATIPDASDPEAPKLTIKDKIALDKLNIVIMEKAAKSKLYVARDAAEGLFERAMGLVRQSVMGIPERLVREMAGFPEEKKLAWRKKAQAQCRAALTSASEEISRTLPGYGKDAE